MSLGRPEQPSETKWGPVDLILPMNTQDARSRQGFLPISTKQAPASPRSPLLGEEDSCTEQQGGPRLAI